MSYDIFYDDDVGDYFITEDGDFVEGGFTTDTDAQYWIDELELEDNKDESIYTTGENC